MGKNGTAFLPRKHKEKLNWPPAGEPFAWLTQELMHSGALRALSINGRRVLDRVMIEHMAHGGQENGRLKITWNDFVKFGISRRLISRSINEVVATGLVAIEVRGKHFQSCNQQTGEPTQYRLTWLPVAEPNNFRPATNEWKRFGESVRAAKAAMQKIVANGTHKRDKPMIYLDLHGS